MRSMAVATCWARAGRQHRVQTAAAPPGPPGLYRGPARCKAVSQGVMRKSLDHILSLVEDGMVPHDGGAPCWAGADDPPGRCLDRATDLDREDEV